MTEARVCQHCGASIAGRHWRTKFCSQKCKDRHRKEARPEQVKAARANWGKTEKAKISRQRWYAERREERRSYARNWYHAHAEIMRKKAQEYRKQKGEEYSEDRALWRGKNRDKISMQSRRRYRKAAAAQHMQEALAALPEIMALAAQLEKTHDK